MKNVGEEGDIYTYPVIIDIAIASILLCVATPSAVPEAMVDQDALRQYPLNSLSAS